MKILAIDTSCDETAVAVTSERRVLSHVEFSQVYLHKQYGGVMPSVAKRAHEERIDFVVDDALKRARVSMDEIDHIAVTYGPGLAIALEVGIKKAVELASKYRKKVIPVNHMEGHLYSSFIQNKNGNPVRDFSFPMLGLLVSGGHTELVLWKDHLSYEIVGETIDDAAGEALDKAARMLGFEYPGGPVIERLAADVDNNDIYKFPRPMRMSNDLNFSYSGLKTAFLYCIKKMSEDEKNSNIKNLSSSFQEAVFNSLMNKTEQAMKNYKVNIVVAGGGVVINKRFRFFLRTIANKYKIESLFPPFNYLTADNAAMIGVAAYYKAQAGIFAKEGVSLDRVPRLSLENPYLIG